MPTTVAALFFLWLAAIGCDRPEKKPLAIPRAEEAVAKCFLYVQGRDSIKLSLISENGKVHGRLAYLFYQKDKSMGTVEGQMQGDTLFVNYRFSAEGMFSVRELALLKKGDAFLMGTGEILNQGNRDIFKDRGTISFEEGMALKRISCDVMGKAIIQ